MKLPKKMLLVLFCSVMSFMFFCDRHALAATFTVDSDGTESDAAIGTNGCKTSLNECTLHAAIQEANNAPGSFILFDDQYTINDCSLPDITANGTVINAYDQWNSDRPGVKLKCGTVNNLLTLDSSDNHIYGLYFFSSNGSGIKIASGSNNTIGTDIYKRRNVFLVTGYGVENVSAGSNNIISSNYFGTPNGISWTGVVGTRGIQSIGSNNSITNNLIIKQSEYGIYLSGNNNTVDHNIVGLNVYEQTAYPNGVGIVLDFASGSDVHDNTIGGNNGYGIWLATNSNNNDIHHNKVSTLWSISDLGNGDHGIYITSYGTGNTIRNNSIADNDGSGIYAKSSTGLTIQRNSISGNQLHGIHFGSAATGIIGGDNSSLSNFISSNSKHGILLEGSSSVTISGNLIGQDSGGVDKGNLLCGISLESGANGNTIGGNSTAEANWIGWNHQDGLRLSGAATMNNTVKNNVFGAPTGFNWQAANKNNGIAILSGAHDNIIGGDGAGNTILASTLSGIGIGSSDNNSLVGNKIGTDGTHNWGNQLNGIGISNSEGNVIFLNEIAYNSPSSSDYDGIKINGSSAINNKISENSIYNNGGEGISLLSGANASIAPPVISREGRKITGTACSNCTVEIFSDAQNEGRFFEGSVVADATGNFSWTGTFQGQFITATATDSTFDTSMFSTAIPAPFPWVMFMPSIIGH